MIYQKNLQLLQEKKCPLHLEKQNFTQPKKGGGDVFLENYFI